MRVLAGIGVLAICSCAALAIYLFGGFYSVAASQPHFDVVAWAVEHIREASIENHLVPSAMPARALKEPSVVQKGAHEFVEEGCVGCHGGPGVQPEKFAKGMRPKPPDLARSTADASPAEVYWIVKHGIKMTGMPAFGGHVDEDELRALVSFVKNMRSFPPADFETLARQQRQASN